MGTKKDLLKFTCRPVESEKDLSIPFRLKRVLASPGKISSVSSAYCSIGKSPPELSEMRCVNTPISQALLTILCKRSAARTKSKEERGSPCLTPLLHLNIFLGVPLSRIEEVPEASIFSIHFIYFARKPLCFMTSRMTWCSTLSKAFSKSSFTIRGGYSDQSTTIKRDKIYTDVPSFQKIYRSYCSIFIYI